MPVYLFAYIPPCLYVAYIAYILPIYCLYIAYIAYILPIFGLFGPDLQIKRETPRLCSYVLSLATALYIPPCLYCLGIKYIAYILLIYWLNSVYIAYIAYVLRI